MLMENFQLSRPVGTGHSRPNDVIRLRKALRETGHGASPPDPSGVYDSSLSGTIKRFQGDYGLEPDGVIMPDGPTARMLDLALTAQRQGGGDGQTQLRDMVGAIGNAGLKPEAPPPGDKRPIVFTDANGNIASPDRLTEIVGHSSNPPVGRRTEETQIAFVPAIAAGIAGADEIAALLGITIGVAGAAKVNEAIKNKAPANQQPTPGPRTPNDANGARRTIDTEANINTLPGTPPSLPSHIPTPPLKHPPIPDENEPKGTPPIPRRPTITVSPIPEEGKPEIEIFPDMSNEFEQWLVQENSRGDEGGQQKDLKLIIDMYYRKRIERGAPVEPTNGGFHPVTGEYQPELFFHMTPGQVKGGRRSDATFVETRNGERVQTDLNVQDMNRSGKTATKRERDAIDDIKAIKARRDGRVLPGETVGLPKSKGLSKEEYENLIGQKLDELIDAQLGRKS